MAEFDALQRRDRYHPAPTGKRVTLKSRDRAWLRFIARHGPLPSNFLHAATADIHANAKATRMRLTDLASETNTPHDGAYLTRPPAQRHSENARNRPLIYDLSSEGWAAIGLARGTTVRANGPFRHQVMVACVTASIELACRQRPDLTYLPAAQILPDIGDLGVTLRAGMSGMPGRKPHRLVPDQLFALSQQTPAGLRYRAFALECDRATEPVRSANLARKSYLRSYLDYRQFIGTGLYRERYGLTCPLLVLNVMTSRARLQRFQQLVHDHAPGGNAYFLFRFQGEFETRLTPAAALLDLLSGPWERAGQPPLRLA